MNNTQQYRQDALYRVQSMLDTTDALSVLNTTPARAQLDAAVTAVGTQSATQNDARTDDTGLLAVQRTAVQTLRQQHMQPIAKFARASLAGAPDMAKLTNSGKGLTPAGLVEAANAMATAAAPYLAQLTEAQFPASVLTDLSAAADAVWTARNNRTDLHASGVGATAGIEDALKSGRQAVMMLDPVVTKLLSGNVALLTQWRTAKRIIARPGGSVSAASTGTSGSTVTPASATVTAAVAAAAVAVAVAERDSGGQVTAASTAHAKTQEVTKAA